MKNILVILLLLFLSFCANSPEKNTNVSDKCKVFQEKSACELAKCVWSKDEKGQDACLDSKGYCKYCRKN